MRRDGNAADAGEIHRYRRRPYMKHAFREKDTIKNRKEVEERCVSDEDFSTALSVPAWNLRSDHFDLLKWRIIFNFNDFNHVDSMYTKVYKMLLKYCPMFQKLLLQIIL